MRWLRLPWVRREKLDMYRRLYNDTARHLLEAEKRAVAAEAGFAVMKEAFQQADRERTDVSMKLASVGFGINPFAEQYLAQQPTQQPPTADDTIVQPLHSGMSPDQVRDHFVQEAIGIYGTAHLGKISRYVAKKQEEYYRFRPNPAAQPITSPEQVQADFMAAVEEGAAEAAKEI